MQHTHINFYLNNYVKSCNSSRQTTAPCMMHTFIPTRPSHPLTFLCAEVVRAGGTVDTNLKTILTQASPILVRDKSVFTFTLKGADSVDTASRGRADGSTVGTLVHVCNIVMDR